MSSQYEFDPTRIAGSGEIVHGTAGATIADRDICCVVNGLYYPADADLAARMPAFALSMSAMSAGQRGEFLVKGFIGLSTWTWTPGSALYVSGTAGQMSHAAGGIRQDVGVAFTATQIFINSQGLDASTPCAILEGATAYVGFDNCKGALFANYFLCDGVADDVQVVLALAYIGGLGGGKLHFERGDYAFATRVTVDFSDLLIAGAGKSTVITYTGNLDTFMFTNVAGIENIEVRDIKFVGGPDNENELLIFDYVNNFRVENCIFKDSGDEAIVVTLLNGVSRNGVIRNNYFEDCPTTDPFGSAIGLQCGHHIVEGNIIEGGLADSVAIGVEAIAGTEVIENVQIINNVIKTPGGVGIFLNANAFDIKNCLIDGNEIYDAPIAGIKDATGGTAAVLDTIITNNIIDGGGTDATAVGAIAIIRNSSARLTINNNSIRNYDPTAASKHGISTLAANSTIEGNNIYNVGDRGINAFGDDIIITGNSIVMVGQAGAGTRDGIQVNADDNIVTNNRIDNCHNGIRVQATADNTLVKNNRMTNITSVIFIDAGTDTRLATKTLSFVDGTFFLGAVAPFGWEIDAATEYAMALGVLPLEVQQVVRWKIWATALVLEADAMRLEVEGYGGASNEPYTTETVAVADHPSETTNFAVNDVIFWLLDATDDTDIDDMVGGDQVMIKVLHEIAGGADCATDAAFTCVEIEYV